MVTVLSPRPDLWTLDPDLLHLNHGSYGAVPRRTQELLAALRAETEANPMRWFRSVAERLTAGRLELASFLRTDPAGFALVSNASAGVTAALATVPIPPGSRIVLTNHAYGAVRYAAERFARANQAEVVMVDVPLEADDDSVLATLEAALDDRTAALVVDQISSATAMVFPIRRIADLCRSRGIPSIVDGAHAPALLDAPAEDGADFWTGNFHKWPAAPRATAGFVVAEKWRTATLPLIVSWSEHDERLPERFDQQGTADYAPWIAAPESLRVLAELEWPRRRSELSAMIDEGARVVAKAVGTSVAEVAHPAATMRLVELPFDGIPSPEAGEAFKTKVSRDLKAEITLTAFDTRVFVRLSAHAYNSPQDYRRLAELLPTLL
ncbi:aminotransferase class V-fold PLP-dependent enzyme [Kribbella sp. CA-293567]|uniref:aminotransferase class V-fold PLP-dependent enzyme n=1 Tax=Kribbella sp. CA-293567 TaxID=3002436 RepID=UPI0022DE26E0|nr:aminotransferase class V-fold PLP-dependent enzyme [Kribbella sp. CA-293567]WBQ01908.1 aminotransferase class V-fold PLP-dependent enzyme [Kribbella sp. CA-293567]